MIGGQKPLDGMDWWIWIRISIGFSPSRTDLIWLTDEVGTFDTLAIIIVIIIIIITINIIIINSHLLAEEGKQLGDDCIQSFCDLHLVGGNIVFCIFCVFLYFVYFLITFSLNNSYCNASPACASQHSGRRTSRNTERESSVRKSFFSHNFLYKALLQISIFFHQNSCKKNKMQGFTFVFVQICLHLPSHNASASPSFPGLTFHTQALGWKETNMLKI